MSLSDSEQYFRRIMDTSVKMDGRDRLRIESVLKDRDYDFVAEALVTLPGAIIIEASGELKEAPNPETHDLAVAAISRLAGLKIGPGFIRGAKDILGIVEDQNVIMDAVVEIARGYLQLNDIAGVPLPEDLDFSDARAVRNFELSIRPEFLNICIPFKEGIEDTFEERGVMLHLRPDIYGPRPGQINRIRRDKVLEAHIFKERIWISEYLFDDSHEMVLEISLDKKTREIIEINSKPFRVPYHNLCELPFMRIHELVGSRLGPDFRELVIKSVGGSTGCSHLVDLLLEITRYLENVYNNE